ncbi:hypothetical protein [Infirmifilum sp.]|uniref:hypothetical protein n=1 Tax=Infirmifilum sp. TaxID=2856575 RepID=UPI003D09D3BB
MAVYSFRGERLSEHSYLTLRLYVTAFGERHEKLISARLALSKDVASLLMRSSCLLHDVGKALRDYQTRMGSFQFHELVSGYFVYETLLSILKGKDLGNYRPSSLARTAALAVIQHHQAMRSLEEILSEGFKAIPLGSGISEEVVEEIRLAARMSANTLPCAQDVLNAFQEAVESSSGELEKRVGQFCEGMIKWLKGIDVGDGEAWLLLLRYQPLLSAPLQVCDSFAALLTRRGQLRGIHRGFLSLL